MRAHCVLLIAVSLGGCASGYADHPTVGTMNVHVGAGARVEIHPGIDCGGGDCPPGDRDQYMPPYHPYSQPYYPARRYGFAREGLSASRLYYRNQPGTVRRRSSGPEGLDPGGLTLPQVRQTPDDQPYQPQGLDPGGLTLQQRERRDRDRGPEGLDPGGLTLDQPRPRPERRRPSAMSRCPYHPYSREARSDPRC